VVADRNQRAGRVGPVAPQAAERLPPVRLELLERERGAPSPDPPAASTACANERPDVLAYPVIRAPRGKGLEARFAAEDLFAWMEITLPKLSGRSDLAAAMRYALARRENLLRYLDGCLAIDNNAAERALRGIALGRKNYLFAGSDAGGERAAAIYSLIETVRLNGLDPQAYLADVIARIGPHPARHLADLLPYNWQPAS
jgi:hypothetical protein